MNNKELTTEVADRITRAIFKNNDGVWYGFCTAVIIFLLLISFGGEVEAKKVGLLNNLSLPNCRIVQDGHTHVKKGNGSVFAYDVACIRGQSFEVKAPEYKEIYEVAYKGVDERLGNYITLRHGKLFFIHGHTKSQLKVGDRLKKGQIIGQTDLSGYTQNYHLHLELWYGNENIDLRAYVNGEGIVKNPKSFKLREQRGWIKNINQIIFENIIAKYEGFSPNTYWDVQHYSYGYGTKAPYKGATITKEEAVKESKIFIQGVRDKYNLSQHSINVQQAVVSFVYNIGSLTNKQKWLLSEGYYKALANDFKLYNGIYIVNPQTGEREKKILAGLVKRRASEALLLTK